MLRSFAEDTSKFATKVQGGGARDVGKKKDKRAAADIGDIENDG